jgi:hypothetical protein
MSLFCVFWAPTVLFLWISLNSENRRNSGGFPALVLGSLVSVLHYLSYPPVNAAGFDFSLWLFALINIVLIPVAPPFLVFALLSVPGFFKGKMDPAGFVLFWLIPPGIVRAFGWSAQNSPLYLILVPLLWTTLALGISFFARLVRESFFPWIIFPLAGIFLMLPAAAAVFWAFYRQMAVAGFILLAVLSIPSVIALAAACPGFNRSRG